MTECNKSTNKILQILDKNKLIAAPLAGVTTPPFRKILRNFFDGLIYTEMVSVEGVKRKMDRTLSLTVKMRLGWDKNSLNCNEMIHIAYEEGAEAVTLHGRTKTDMYSGHVNYDLIAEAKSKAKLPIIGNGDILDYESYQKMLATGVDGVMIGRGMMKQPWIFASIAAESDPNGFLSTDELYSLIRDMIEYEKEFKGDRKFLETIKKYIVWFLKGLPNVTPFRNTLFTLRTEEQIINLLDDYFEQVNQSIICSMSDEAVG